VDRRGGVGGATRQRGCRRVTGRWFNADSGSSAPTIELGFGDGRISVTDHRGGWGGGGRWTVRQWERLVGQRRDGGQCDRGRSGGGRRSTGMKKGSHNPMAREEEEGVVQSLNPPGPLCKPP
jgi:hypothetical protein